MKERLQAWGDSTVIRIVSGLVLNEHQELLLLRRHADDLGGGKWSTPGGRIDPGETPEQAMRREFYEETGVRTADVQLLGAHRVLMPHGGVHMMSYLIRLSGNTAITLDPEEHQGYEWFELPALMVMTGIIWGLPTVLHDFGLLSQLDNDPTLNDGSRIEALEIS